jgi:cobalt-zinc-cadmium efflux system membrane fusion protein
MKKAFISIAALAITATVFGAITLVPRSLLPWALPNAAGQASPEPGGAKDAATPPGGPSESGRAIEGVIDMPLARIEAQGIEIAPARPAVLARLLAAPGTITLDPGRVARVPGRVEGTVTQMRKRLGDPVTPGEVVAVLDSREVADAKSEYLTAQVALDLQKILFERQKILWAQKSNAETQYLQAREAFLEAELKLGLARQKLVALNLEPAQVEKSAKQESAPGSSTSSLREYEIRSLVSGRVIERKVDVGQLVGRQGDPTDLYTVADLSVVWVELAVPMADLEVIEEGQPVIIESGADSGKRGEGRIIFVSPLVDPNTRSARVVAEVDNKTMIWRPGAIVTASIVIKRESAGISVPRAALQTIGGERVVFVRTPSGFQKRSVIIGRTDEQNVEITSGLSADEQIAVKNTFLLKAELGKGQAGEGD